MKQCLSQESLLWWVRCWSGRGPTLAGTGPAGVGPNAVPLVPMHLYSMLRFLVHVHSFTEDLGGGSSTVHADEHFTRTRAK